MIGAILSTIAGAGLEKQYKTASLPSSKNKNIKSSMPAATKNNVSNSFAMFDANRAALNKSLISFKGYYGDSQPLKKLFWISTGRNDVYEDNWTNNHLYQVGTKKMGKCQTARAFEKKHGTNAPIIMHINKTE